MLSEKELMEYLAARRAGVPRPDLAERIILAARARPQKRRVFAWLFDAMQAAVPRHAYSLAGALALGIMIGYIAPLQMRAVGAMSDLTIPLDAEDMP